MLLMVREHDPTQKRHFGVVTRLSKDFLLQLTTHELGPALRVEARILFFICPKVEMTEFLKKKDF